MTSLKLKQVIFLWSLVVVVVVHVECSITECPRYCKCDVYRQLNRVECSSRHLISAKVDFNHVVQILDLSFNDITTIETVQSYQHLVLLNLSHNAIYTLELQSFSQLRRIQEIDLSHNRLQYLDDRTFERNRKLHKLNLESNKFITIAVKPFLKSSSLKQLNLRNSQITLINKSLFSQLPKLEELNLAENLLNNFLPQDFDGLVKLKILNLSQNPMRCDKSMQQKLQQLLDKGIQVSMDECEISQETLPMVKEKFQIMRAMPAQLPQPEDNESSIQSLYDFAWKVANHQDKEDEFDENYQNLLRIQEDLLTNNEWLKSAPDAVLCKDSTFKLCQNYRQCLQNFNNARHENRPPRSFFSSEDKFGFFLGVACGLSTAIILVPCALCTKSCLKNKRKERHRDAELTMDTEPLEVSPQPLARPRQQLPPQVRRGPRRRAPMFNNRLSRQFSNERSAGSETEIGNAIAPIPETPPPCYGAVVGDASAERH